MTSQRLFVGLVRWVARAVALLALLFWGAFFIEHLQEWFIQPFPDAPPVYVWFAQLLHFLILAGLIIGLQWERAGGILVVAASVLFLMDKAPALIPLTTLPGILYLYCWWNGRLPGVTPGG